jgi:hypothetical protein
VELSFIEIINDFIIKIEMRADTIKLLLEIAFGFIVIIVIIAYTDRISYLSIENKVQRQTIIRLNDYISKMDTLHEKCFRVNEFKKNKK